MTVLSFYFSLKSRVADFIQMCLCARERQPTFSIRIHQSCFSVFDRLPFDFFFSFPFFRFISVLLTSTSSNDASLIKKMSIMKISSMRGPTNIIPRKRPRSSKQSCVAKDSQCSSPFVLSHSADRTTIKINVITTNFGASARSLWATQRLKKNITIWKAISPRTNFSDQLIADRKASKCSLKFSGWAYR